MHRLQAVARIGQRARYDHAYGVIEVGAFHLIEDRNGRISEGTGGSAGPIIFSVRQGEIRSGSKRESYSASGARITTLKPL